MSEAEKMSWMRRILAVLFVSGSVGTAAELLLLEHTEGTWQQAPLILIVLGCVGLAILAIWRSRHLLRVFQVTMALFVASGIAGIVLHYNSNVEFELELQPGAAGIELFMDAMMGAMPALAPGTMILLGALGFTYAWATAQG